MNVLIDIHLEITAGMTGRLVCNSIKAVKTNNVFQAFLKKTEKKKKTCAYFICLHTFLWMWLLHLLSITRENAQCNMVVSNCGFQRSGHDHR